MSSRTSVLLSVIAFSQLLNAFEIDYGPCSWEGIPCYGLPVDCIQSESCSVLATLYPYKVSSKLQINLQADLEAGMYAQIKLSDNKDMSESFMYYCAPYSFDFVWEAYGVDGIPVDGTCAW